MLLAIEKIINARLTRGGTYGPTQQNKFRRVCTFKEGKINLVLQIFLIMGGGRLYCIPFIININSDIRRF